MKRTHYILSVHWDREWYETLEEFRIRLIPLMDEVLEGLESGEMKGPFVTDGQTILIDDYLDMRPERTGRVKECIGNGQISAGAWYVMPDLFQVSGESLVRNIELGMKSVENWGGKAPLSLNCCDVFGLNSQMPQIAAQFGLKAAFLWRGINKTDNRNLIWIGADGTELPCFRFGLNGYWHYTVRIRQGCDRDSRAGQSSFDKRLQRVLEDEEQRTDIDSLMLFDGMDHSHWDREYYKLLFSEKRKDIVHSTLDQMALELKNQMGKITTVIRGEQREPGNYDREEHALLAGTLSSRTYLKRANASCEHLLTNLVEPWAAFASLVNGKSCPDDIFIDRAWKLLLQNHPHDSICGTSIDEVHRDMMVRFRQCSEIGEKVLKRSLESIAFSAGDNGMIDENTHKLVLFQSLEQKASSLGEVILDIPLAWRISDSGEWADSTVAGFEIRDDEGRIIPVQILEEKRNRNRYHADHVKSVRFYQVDEVRCLLETNLEAMGVKALYLCKSDTNYSDSSSPRDLLENGFLRVSVQNDGRIALLDKRTGHLFSDLFSFESEVERGTPFHHETGKFSDIRTDKGSFYHIENLSSGIFSSSLTVIREMELPLEYDFSRNCRSGEKNTVTIGIELTLRKDDPRLYSEITVDNRVYDHRLTVLFPSLEVADSYISDTPYDVITRPIGKRKEFVHSYERDVECHPQSSFTAVHSGGKGLAVISDGLKEAAVLERKEHPVMQTLIRGYRKFKFRNGEIDSQMIGRWTFPFIVQPIAGDVDTVSLLNSSREIHGNLRVCQFGPDQIFGNRGRTLQKSDEKPIFRIEGQISLSSMRIAEKGILEVRIWNPADHYVSGSLHFNEFHLKSRGIVEWGLTDFKGKLTGPVELLKDASLTVELRGKEIITIRIGKNLYGR